jgi:hypothetical protein
LKIEYLWNASDLNMIIKNGGATRGASACAARATSANIQYSMVNPNMI